MKYVNSCAQPKDWRGRMLQDIKIYMTKKNLSSMENREKKKFACPESFTSSSSRSMINNINTIWQDISQNRQRLSHLYSRQKIITFGIFFFGSSKLVKELTQTGT